MSRPPPPRLPTPLRRPRMQACPSCTSTCWHSGERCWAAAAAAAAAAPPSPSPPRPGAGAGEAGHVVPHVVLHHHFRQQVGRERGRGGCHGSQCRLCTAEAVCAWLDCGGSEDRAWTGPAEGCGCGKGTACDGWRAMAPTGQQQGKLAIAFGILPASQPTHRRCLTIPALPARPSQCKCACQCQRTSCSAPLVLHRLLCAPPAQCVDRPEHRPHILLLRWRQCCTTKHRPAMRLRRQGSQSVPVEAKTGLPASCKRLKTAHEVTKPAGAWLASAGARAAMHARNTRTQTTHNWPTGHDLMPGLHGTHVVCRRHPASRPPTPPRISSPRAPVGTAAGGARAARRGNTQCPSRSAAAWR